MNKNKSKKVNFTRRPNGEGSVYKMQDGRYGAAISLGKSNQGKRLRHVETGRTEQEVIDKMTLWLSQNGYTEQDKVVLNTVEEFIEYFKVNELLTSGISDATYDNYCYMLKYFEDYFRGKRLADIDRNSIKQFFSDMSKAKTNGEYKYSDVTIKRVKFIVGKLYTWAVEEEKLKSSPVDWSNYKPPLSKKETVSITALTTSELQIIKNAVMGNKAVYPVIAVMAHTGMRTEEALALQWQDIDFDDSTIHVHHALTKEFEKDGHGNKVGNTKTVIGSTKNKYSERYIQVPDEVMDLLKKWREDAPFVSQTKIGDNHFVFGNTKGSNWTYAGFRSSVNNCLKRSGAKMDSLRLHRLRHTVATMISNDPDATAYTLQQLLGHKDTRMAHKYIDSETDERRKKNKVMLGRMYEGKGLCE